MLSDNEDPMEEDDEGQDDRDSFEKQYQEALTLFCRGKLRDAFELWSLLVDNPLALPSTQQKVAVSLGQCHSTGTGKCKIVHMTWCRDGCSGLFFLRSLTPWLRSVELNCTGRDDEGPVEGRGFLQKGG